MLPVCPAQEWQDGFQRRSEVSDGQHLQSYRGCQYLLEPCTVLWDLYFSIAERVLLTTVVVDRSIMLSLAGPSGASPAVLSIVDPGTRAGVLYYSSRPTRIWSEGQGVAGTRIRGRLPSTLPYTQPNVEDSSHTTHKRRPARSTVRVPHSSCHCRAEYRGEPETLDCSSVVSTPRMALLASSTPLVGALASPGVVGSFETPPCSSVIANASSSDMHHGRVVMYS